MRHPTIGALRHRLRLEAPQTSADGGGGGDETWSLVTEIWGEVIAASGQETFEADGLSGRISHEIAIRYRNDVAAKQRFVEDGRVYDIRAVLDREGRRRWLHCLCVERVA